MENKVGAIISLSGLWQRVDKNGDLFFTGSLGKGVNLFVFKNHSKKREKDPDYILYVTNTKKEEKNVD